MSAGPSLVDAFADLLQPGSRYEVKKAIGKGAFSTVMLLGIPGTTQQVVGKFMDLSKMSERNRQFALNEAHNAAKLVHPNIIQFIERHQREDKLLLIFEYADAGELYQQIVARAPSRYFKEPEILLIFSQLCLAINQLHRQKMLHRDLKTPNIFLTTNGLIKLGDFGFSREYDQTVSSDVGSTFCGTPYYLAPELWNQAPYSKKADMWSVGVILYELMALRRPFAGATMRELVDNVVAGRTEPLPDQYTPELKQLCLDLLSLDPKVRPSIEDLFRRDIVRERGLLVLQKNVPRLVTVPEATRQNILMDIDFILTQAAQAPVAAPDDE